MDVLLERIESWLGGPAGLVLAGLVLLLMLGWYLSYLAGRLDRLHHRVESAGAALQARLVRRAAAAREVARLLPAPAGAALVAAAGRTLTSSVAAAGSAPDVVVTLVSPVSEVAENELSRALHRGFEDPATAAGLRADPAAAALLDELETASYLVQLARRFHNDAVAHALRMRRKRVVRWAWLAGRAALPKMVEIDDSTPAGLPRDLMAAGGTAAGPGVDLGDGR